MMTRAALILVLILSAALSGRAAPGPELHCASNHILLRFKPTVRSLLSDVAPTNQLSTLLTRLGLPRGAELHETALARRFRPKNAPGSRRRHEPIDPRHFLYLRLTAGLTVSEAVRRLENHPLIDYAEPDWIGHGAATIPTDPNFIDQWHHRNSSKPSASIQTPLAWEITPGSANVLVGVLDTGLATLAEFTGRTVPGYNFAYGDSDTTDDNGHGTAVASVLCASANNGFSGAGVDWRCRIMPVKVLDDWNTGFYSWWAQGIDFAVSNGCKIINLSAGGTSYGRTLERAITNAIAHDVIFVTTVANDGSPDIGFPGYLESCITVGATDRSDSRAEFSDYGPELDLVAPGVDIATLGTAGDLELVSGTSFSAPMVAGVCALLAAVRPGLTQAEAHLLLSAGADDQVGGGTDTPGFDIDHGWGRLNAFNSLLLATTRVDEIRRTNGRVEMSWTSPANASNRQPYQVECKTSLNAAWIPLNDTNGLRYESGRTHWMDDGTGAGSGAQFFRVRLRQP
jgi:subtilisin family serine protease